MAAITVARNNYTCNGSETESWYNPVSSLVQLCSVHPPPHHPPHPLTDLLITCKGLMLRTKRDSNSCIILKLNNPDH